MVGVYGVFLADDLTALTGLFEFFVAGFLNRVLATIESVLGGDEADGRVQPGDFTWCKVPENLS